MEQAMQQNISAHWMQITPTFRVQAICNGPLLPSRCTCRILEEASADSDLSVMSVSCANRMQWAFRSSQENGLRLTRPCKVGRTWISRSNAYNTSISANQVVSFHKKISQVKSAQRNRQCALTLKIERKFRKAADICRELFFGHPS